MEHGEQQKPSLRKIITVASIACGVQFGWALQLSLLTPYVQTLGVPHEWTSFIWLCGPLSGLLVQPIVGYYSDRCTSRFGRRRPFIAAGGFFIAVAVILIGYAKDIGYKTGDALDEPVKPVAIALFVLGMTLLDVANNMLQGPCRAFLADISEGNHEMMRMGNGFFAFFMALGNVLGYSAGSYEDLHKFFPFTQTVACSNTSCANLKSCVTIDIVFLLVVLSYALSTVQDKPLEKQVESDSETQDGFGAFIGNLLSAFRSLKKPMWILFLTTTLTWVAWFPFVLYNTDWMGREVYGGKAQGNEHEKSLYDDGVRSGAVGLLINSVVLALFSGAIEPLGRLLGGVKRVWGGVNIILAVAMAMTVLITKNAEEWRQMQPSGAQLHEPPAHIKASALSFFGVLGIPLAVTYAVPFALASIYSSAAGGGQGLSLGVLNLAIVIPQMIVAVVSGPIDQAFGGGNLPAFVMGAIAAAISVPVTLFVLPNTPQQAAIHLPVGGH